MCSDRSWEPPGAWLRAWSMISPCPAGYRAWMGLSQSPYPMAIDAWLIWLPATESCWWQEQVSGLMGEPHSGRSPLCDKCPVTSDRISLSCRRWRGTFCFKRGGLKIRVNITIRGQKPYDLITVKSRGTELRAARINNNRLQLLADQCVIGKRTADVIACWRVLCDYARASHTPSIESWDALDGHIIYKK